MTKVESTLILGTIITQAITIQALHEAGVIDKQKIIDMADTWAASVAALDEPTSAVVCDALKMFAYHVNNTGSGDDPQHGLRLVTPPPNREQPQ